MYCRCQNPKKKTSEANGEKFTICALSLGGCGEEVIDSREFKNKDGWPVDPAIKKDYSVEITFAGTGLDILINPTKACPECEGGGMTIKCYGGMPQEIKCGTCWGTGLVDDEDDD